ncbi:MAG: transposase [Verrucomicrobia bacterium]|nr:transposase [Verrucomicrobiota bacterium]
MSRILPFQTELRPAIPCVRGNVDYSTFEAELFRIDEILHLSGVENYFVELSTDHWLKKWLEGQPSHSQVVNHQHRSRRALRCILLQRILAESFRKMSRRLAECSLFQWFCGFTALEEVRVPGKSELERFSDWLPVESMNLVLDRLTQAASQKDPLTQVNCIWLANQIELDTVWLDSTCLKANIHFPVDWVLLRDVARTLMKATITIRKHGLKRRMVDPSMFLKQMNQLSIAMTHTGRKPGSKKARKVVLRKMKKLLKLIRDHALRHRDMLDLHWKETDWTRPQAEQVLGPIDSVLGQLDEAVRQAHERIIGGRQVKNQDKILSLYDENIHVIKRGKSGAEVEFGNTLLIVEQAQGYVVDWKLHKDSAESDSKQVKPCAERLDDRIGVGVIKAMIGDRGFASKGNEQFLNEKEIFDGLCPRGVDGLKKRLKGKRFRDAQRRRAQTEGRIGVLQNEFFGRPMRSKGIENRELAVAWSVLTHNLWVLARLKRIEDAEQTARAA